MKLLLDAGNTRLKWGLWAADAWAGQGVLEYDALAQLPAVWAAHSLPTTALAVNVAGPEIGAQIMKALATAGVPLHFLHAHAAQAGVVNRYRAPTQLGADRWAALIGARARQPGPALVVCAGTATTIDLLDANGIFHGGLIVPGLTMMRESLAAGTAALPLAQALYQAVPRSTEEAIVSGCLAAQVGAITQFWAHIAREPSALCLLSGGNAPALLPLLPMPVRHIPNLVLEGLACVVDDMAEPPPIK